ncbi:hypothetical protein BH23GEM7_BH23GEM7_39760 [soil metagenome]
MRYHNLDLWIDASADGGYPLRASCERHGESGGLLALDPAELGEWQRALEAGEADRAQQIELGSRLYAALFGTSEVGAQFDRCRAASSGPEQGIRLRLRIDPPEIAALPWEYLYSPKEECFVGASIHTPLVRYLEISQRIRELETTPPLQMLVLISQGSGPGAAREKAHLLKALEAVEGQVEPTFLEERVTCTAISDLLLERKFHLLHFIGHGEFEDDRGYLLLSDEEGGDEYVDQERFGSLFLNHPTLKLVVLNACEGARVSTTRSLVGMAPQIVKQGIPAVVAMQYAIYDTEAVLFAREFYFWLFRSWNRGRVEVAMAHARNRLGAEFPESRAVGAPVLFMYAPEGVLFDVTGDRLLPLGLGRREMHTQREIIRTRERNIRLLMEEQRRTGDPAAAADLSRERAGLAGIQRRIRFRNLSLAAAGGAALTVFLLLWIGVFNLLPRWLQLETYGVWIADAFAGKTVDERLALVGISRDTERSVGRVLGPSWRAEHARVLDALSRGGARVVAFDMYFPRPDPRDSAFAQAIREARERGTAVVIGTDSVVGGRPRVTPTLRGEVQHWGVLCLGSRATHSAKIMPLLVVPEGQPAAEGVPSLALRSVAAYHRAIVVPELPNREVDLVTATRDLIRVGVSEVFPVREAQPGCPSIWPGDTVAAIVLDYSPLATLRGPRHRTPYEAILNGSESLAPDAFRDRIVLIGSETGEDEFRVWRGMTVESRHGYELHADAVNALLRGATVRPLGSRGQFGVLLLLALFAAMLVYLIPDRARLRLGVLALLLVAYLAAAVYLYATQRILLITLYHVAALLVSYGLVRTLQRRWFS